MRVCSTTWTRLSSMETYQHQVVFSATKGNFKISNDLYFINFYRIGHLASYIFTISDFVLCDSIYLFNPFKFINCTKVFCLYD